MNANETVLIVLMQNFRTRRQQALVLEKYVQRYGPLSQEAGERVKELLLTED